jgi:hypothetical protein
MKNNKLTKLSVIGSIIDNSSIFKPCCRSFTFFDYHLYQRQVEIFKNSLNKEIKLEINTIETKSKKRYFRWLKRILVSLAMICFAYFFLNIPNAIACNVLKNKIVIKSLWNVVANTKETKKEEKSSYVSKKVLIIGGVALTLAIGAILFHQTGISRKLFTPKLEEIPLPNLPSTLPDIEILKNINFQENMKARRSMFNTITKAFGKTNFFNLVNGQMEINGLNNQQVFTLLARLLKQLVKITQYESFVKGIDNVEKYVNASDLEDLNEMREIILRGLNRVILYNPDRLVLFKDYMGQVLTAVESGKSIPFTSEMEKALITDLLGNYLYQNVLDAMKPYYTGKK